MYCSMRHARNGWIASEVLDESSFEARRRDRLRYQRQRIMREGLVGTVAEVDTAGKQVAVMLRRADSWYGRALKVHGLAGLSGNGFQRTECEVVDVHPDYSRLRLRLDFRGSALPTACAGQEVAVFAALPEKVDFELPPDLDRFKARQERIDYFLSTLYCPCGMMGDSCAGHWNTLAACKLHGCGMPNLISKEVGEWIDEGKSDSAILTKLVEQNGANVLKVHQN